MEKPFPAYRGNEPYVFVRYSHEDSDVVYPEITRLHEQGFNLWYDEGISAGKNWRAAIGESLLGAIQAYKGDRGGHVEPRFTSEIMRFSQTGR